MRALEAEINDLHGEFELDRLDYLETIRRQDQQLKLMQQILEKVQPVIRKDANYADLGRVKKEAVWNEDQGRWLLPDLLMAKGRLPNAGHGEWPRGGEVSFHVQCSGARTRTPARTRRSRRASRGSRR